MKSDLHFLAFALTLTCARTAFPQIYDTNNVVVQTFAGSGFYGYLDGVGQQTMFYNPIAVVADQSGNLFVADSVNSRIRKISPDGTVSTFAGGAYNAPPPPGYGTNVFLSGAFYGMTIDHANALWLYTSGILYRIGGDGYVEKKAGVPEIALGLCVDSKNNVYFSDYNGNKIWKYGTNSALGVFVGSGNPGSADGSGFFTSFNTPAAIATDAADNIYVWDSGNGVIRKINPNRDVVTIAGLGAMLPFADGTWTNATFQTINGMCVDEQGSILITCGSTLRKISPATNTLTLAGGIGQRGYTNGLGSLARFRTTAGVCVSHGTIFVTDSEDQRIRSITSDPPEIPVSPGNLKAGTFAGLYITGTIGRAYRIESSTDAATWTPETILLLTSSPYLWIDPHAAGSKKFYRAFLLP